MSVTRGEGVVESGAHCLRLGLANFVPGRRDTGGSGQSSEESCFEEQTEVLRTLRPPEAGEEQEQALPGGGQEHGRKS